MSESRTRRVPPTKLIALLVNAVMYLDPDREDIFYQVGAAIHHATDGSEDGFDVFDGWRAMSIAQYPGRAAIEAQWQAYGEHANASITMDNLRNLTGRAGVHWAGIVAETNEMWPELPDR